MAASLVFAEIAAAAGPIAAVVGDTTAAAAGPIVVAAALVVPAHIPAVGAGAILAVDLIAVAPVAFVDVDT